MELNFKSFVCQNFHIWNKYRTIYNNSLFSEDLISSLKKMTHQNRSLNYFLITLFKEINLTLFSIYKTTLKYLRKLWFQNHGLLSHSLPSCTRFPSLEGPSYSFALASQYCDVRTSLLLTSSSWEPIQTLQIISFLCFFILVQHSSYHLLIFPFPRQCFKPSALNLIL